MEKLRGMRVEMIDLRYFFCEDLWNVFKRYDWFKCIRVEIGGERC